MRRLHRFECALACVLLLAASAAWAGPNAGGTLILHINESFTYCQDHTTYCGQAGLASCATADNSVSGSSRYVFFALAAFPEMSSPRLSGVTFGVEYGMPAVSLVDQGLCGDFELASSGWPNPGSGTAVTWNSARTALLTEVYWFAGYNYYYPNPTTFAVVPHPQQGGWFADDSVPSILDPIADYGVLGFNAPGFTPCPLPPAEAGACCFPDGSCRLRTQAMCDGDYQGDATACSPNPCPQPPTGACCFPDEHCTVSMFDWCASHGGTYLGDDTSCAPNPCTRAGGCCLMTGTCLLTTDEECANSNGSYYGDDVPCEAVPCVPSGACCVGYSCSIRSLTVCQADGGAYRGDGTLCSPNPCAGGGCSNGAATGARNGEARSVGRGAGALERATTDLGCGDLNLNSDGGYENGYTWQYGGVVAPTYGAFAECYSGPSQQVCSIVFDLTQVGYQSGQRMDVYVWNDDAGCPGVVRCVRTNVDPGPIAYWPELSRHVVNLDGCDVDGAFWVGWWGNWPGQLAPWYVGADLDGMGGCPLTNVAPGIGFPTGWTNASQVWGPTQALGIGCETIGGDQTRGACCLSSGACQRSTSFACENWGGTYQGDDTTCDPNPCPPAGACCASDGSCTLLTSDACAHQGGHPMGEGTTCDPNPCDELPGACCVPTGECQVLDFAACAELYGLWQGYGTSCEPVVCPAIGACCHEDGSCLAILEQACWNTGGIYQGDGTVCDPNPCPQPGACCYSDGSCAILQESNCVGGGGSFQGGSTSCDPNPCPPAGACCTPDAGCYVIISALCVNQGGHPMGDGTTCDPNPCFDLPGACCIPSGECEVLDRETCDTLLGLWGGYGVSCESYPCPAVGACCFADGSCRTIYYDSCIYAGGGYQGDGVACSPNPCPQPGACCFLDGTCSVELPANCESGQGSFQGDGSACDPNPCPQPCSSSPIVRWENAPAPLPRTAGWPVAGAAPKRDDGPNAGGTLILHTNPALIYTSDASPYCGQAGLARCEDAITRKDGSDPTVIFALAAFPERSHPRMAGVTFGLSYGTCVVLDGWGACADFELPTAQWPSSGEGTALTWNVAQTGLLTEVYWFAAYAYEGRIDELALAAHPTQGAYFADDSVPALLDGISFLGRFGFNRGGTLGCPTPLPATGGCCLMNGTCIVTTYDDCYVNHGSYYGDDVPCSAHACVPTGACCIGYSCYIRTHVDCLADGGTYHGDGSLCTSGLCGGGGGCAHVLATGSRTEEAKSVGLGTGTLLGATSGTGCGSLNINSDGGYENGYAWQYGGVLAPTYGSFAECYTSAGYQSVCSVVFDFTQVGFQAGQCMDVYVWHDGGGVPGSVACVTTNVNPGTVAFWPSLSRHVINISSCCPDGAFWVGYWGNWPGELAPWYVGADLDGFGGCPLTNIAPGIGFPTGWTNTSQVWGPTQALGIGCELSNCGPTAVRKMSWGRVKTLYQGEGEKRR